MYIMSLKKSQGAYDYDSFFVRSSMEILFVPQTSPRCVFRTPLYSFPNQNQSNQTVISFCVAIPCSGKLKMAAAESLVTALRSSSMDIWAHDDGDCCPTLGCAASAGVCVCLTDPSSQISISPSRYPLVSFTPCSDRMSSRVLFLSMKMPRWSLMTCRLWHDGQRINTVPLW